MDNKYLPVPTARSNIQVCSNFKFSVVNLTLLQSVFSLLSINIHFVILPIDDTYFWVNLADTNSWYDDRCNTTSEPNTTFHSVLYHHASFISADMTEQSYIHVCACAKFLQRHSILATLHSSISTHRKSSVLWALPLLFVQAWPVTKSMYRYNPELCPELCTISFSWCTINCTENVSSTTQSTLISTNTHKYYTYISGQHCVLYWNARASYISIVGQAI